jgi:phospholipid/cholesterol/gamma-HCH transport system permease protein
VGLGVMFTTEYLMTVVNLGGISSGGYLYIFWLYQNPADFVFGLAKVMAMGRSSPSSAASTATPPQVVRSE